MTTQLIYCPFCGHINATAPIEVVEPGDVDFHCYECNTEFVVKMVFYKKSGVEHLKLTPEEIDLLKNEKWFPQSEWE